MPQRKLVTTSPRMYESAQVCPPFCRHASDNVQLVAYKWNGNARQRVQQGPAPNSCTSIACDMKYSQQLAFLAPGLLCARCHPAKEHLKKTATFLARGWARGLGEIAPSSGQTPYMRSLNLLPNPARFRGATPCAFINCKINKWASGASLPKPHGR